MTSGKRQAVAASAVQQLTLLQVLLMLPADVVLGSFGRQFSKTLYTDFGNLRLVCWEACQLVQKISTGLKLRLGPSAPVSQLVKCVNKFTGLSAVGLYLPQRSQPSQLSASFISELLYKCRAQFKHVTRVVLGRIPFTHATSVAVQTTFPELQQLTVTGCTVQTHTSVFEPFVNLLHLKIEYVSNGSTQHTEAAQSLWALPCLQSLELHGNCSLYYFDKAAPEHSQITRLGIQDVSDQALRTISQLTHLEELEVYGIIDIISPSSGCLRTLKRLKVNSKIWADRLFELLPLPALESIEWERAHLCIDVRSLIPAEQWPDRAAAGLQSLQHLVPGDSFPVLSLHGFMATSEEVTSFFQGLPVLPECKELWIDDVDMTADALRALAGKLPKLATMHWRRCASDRHLPVVADFKELQTLEIHELTHLSAMGLALVPTLLGQRAVRIGVTSCDLTEMADVDWANELLASRGLSSVFF